MPNQYTKKDTTPTPEDLADESQLQALRNLIAKNSLGFQAFMEHLQAAFALLQHWDRLQRQVDRLERRQADLAMEIGQLTERANRLKEDVYAR